MTVVTLVALFAAKRMMSTHEKRTVEFFASGAEWTAAYHGDESWGIDNLEIGSTVQPRITMTTGLLTRPITLCGAIQLGRSETASPPTVMATAQSTLATMNSRERILVRAPSSN